MAFCLGLMLEGSVPHCEALGLSANKKSGCYSGSVPEKARLAPKKIVAGKKRWRLMVSRLKAAEGERNETWINFNLKGV